MRGNRRSPIVPLLVSLLILAGCGGEDGQSADTTDSTGTAPDTTIDGGAAVSDDQAAATTAGASSSTSALSVTTPSTSTSTSTSTSSTTTEPTPCSSASVAGDLGAGSTVVDGACEGGWAVVDVCDAEPCGDSWVLARHQGGGWAVVTGFPTALCRGDLSAEGAPDRVLDVVHWPPCGNATGTSTETTVSGTVDVDTIVDVFIAAWDAGDWATMSSVADPVVVEAARAAAVPGGSVLPGPPRGRCFFGFPNTTCEVAYGSGGAGMLYTLTVTDRIVTMEPSG